MKTFRIQTLLPSLFSSAFLLPAFASAQTDAPTTFTGFVVLAIDILKMVIPLIVGFGILLFFWGLVKFINRAGDVKSHDDGRTMMIWGIIGLFVMVSLWGILQFLGDQFGFADGGTAITTLPQ